MPSANRPQAPNGRAVGTEIQRGADHAEIQPEAGHGHDRDEGGYVERSFAAGGELDSRQERDGSDGENGHLGGNREAPPEAVEEEEDRRARGDRAEQRGDAHPERHPALGLVAIHVELPREAVQHAVVVTQQPRARVRVERQNAIEFEGLELASKGVDPVHARLGRLPGCGRADGCVDGHGRLRAPRGGCLRSESDAVPGEGYTDGSGDGKRPPRPARGLGRGSRSGQGSLRSTSFHG